MPAALKEALAKLETLAAELTPEELDQAALQLRELADDLQRRREWDELISSPESVDFLRAGAAEVAAERAAGELRDGGWE